MSLHTSVIKLFHSDTIMPYQTLRATDNNLLMPYFLLHIHLLWHDNQNSAISLLCHPTLGGTAGLKLNFRGGK